MKMWNETRVRKCGEEWAGSPKRSSPRSLVKITNERSVRRQERVKIRSDYVSIELHDMLILLMQRGFGVKDVDSFVRKKYAYGEISEENFAKYRELMRSFKSKVNQCASLITSNVRAANTIYPRSMHEYETRRDYQNAAIVNCEQLINELQRVVEIFDVDLNLYNRYVKAIDEKSD